MLLMNRREIRNFEAECLQNGDWRGQMRRDRKKVIWLLLQVLISAWAIQGQALTEISWEGYLVDIPVIRYLFRAFQDTQGWGLESCFCMAGFFCLFWMVKKGKERYACGRQIWITVDGLMD